MKVLLDMDTIKMLNILAVDIENFERKLGVVFALAIINLAAVGVILAILITSLLPAG